MKKFLLLLFALIASTSIGFAETKTVKWEAASSYANSETTLNSDGWTLTITDGGYTGFDGTKGMQIGSGSAPASTITIASSNKSEFNDKAITSVKVNASTASSATASLSVKVGTTTVDTKSLTTTATDYTFDCKGATGTVTITISQPSTKKALYLKSISVTYEDGGSNLNPANLKFPQDSYSVFIEEKDSFESPVATGDDGIGAITYTSSKTTVATVDENSGKVTIKGLGTTTITATSEATDKVNGGTASYELTVFDTVTEITPNFFGYTSSAYNATSKGDMFVDYSTVYSGSTSQFQFNTNNDNGKGSGIAVVKTNDDYIIEFIEVEMITNSNGLNIYSSDKAFNTLTKTGTPSFGDPIETITSNSRIDINNHAFAILPAKGGAISVQKVTVHYALKNKTNVTLSFQSPTYTAIMGQDFESPVLTVTPEAAKSEVKYKSTDITVGKVSADGSIELVGPGETTITASISGSFRYADAETSYILTVEASTEPETKVGNPIINIEEGDVDVNSTVTISSATEGAKIYAIVTYGEDTDEIDEIDEELPYVFTFNKLGKVEIECYAYMEDGTLESSDERKFTFNVVCDEQIAWKKITSLEELTLDGEYIIASIGDNYSSAMIIPENSVTYMPSSNVDVNNDIISISKTDNASLRSNIAVVTFEGEDLESVYLKISDLNGDVKGYYVPTADKKMSLSKTVSATSKAKVTFNETTKVFTITFASYGSLQYNSSDPRFLNYTSNQKPICIFKKHVQKPSHEQPQGSDVKENIYITAHKDHTLYYKVFVYDTTRPETEALSAPRKKSAAETLEEGEYAEVVGSDVLAEATTVEGNTKTYVFSTKQLMKEADIQSLDKLGENKVLHLSLVSLDPYTGNVSDPTAVGVTYDGNLSGVESVVADGEAEAEFFNLQGVRMAQPLAPGIYIRRQGAAASKVVVK